MDVKKCLKTLLSSETLSAETAELIATMAKLIETQRTMIDKLLEDRTDWQTRNDLINESLKELLAAQSQLPADSQVNSSTPFFPPLSDN